MSDSKAVKVNKPVLSKNDEIAARIRERLHRLGLYVINIISSPGSGKTTLLECLAKRLGPALAVIEGDLQTRRDAERVESAGAFAYQIETGGACHLDAAMVETALDAMDLEHRPELKILIIENVGNLVCPSSYDLGEHIKIGILSVPEGDDKVLKYPSLFKRVDLFLINKIDLLPHMEFDADRAQKECQSLNDRVRTFRLSAKTQEGVDDLCQYLLDAQSTLAASSRE